jgi:hypothetical protein
MFANSGPALALDRRTLLRLAQPLAPIEGLRGLTRNDRSVDPNRHDPIDGQAARSQDMTFSDRF